MPPPRKHLLLKVRAHHVSGFSVQGDRSAEIGVHFPTARRAVQVIRDFARTRGCTARVTVYTVYGDVYRVVEMTRT